MSSNAHLCNAFVSSRLFSSATGTQDSKTTLSAGWGRMVGGVSRSPRGSLSRKRVGGGRRPPFQGRRERRGGFLSVRRPRALHFGARREAHKRNCKYAFPKLRL